MWKFLDTPINVSSIFFHKKWVLLSVIVIVIIQNNKWTFILSQMSIRLVFRDTVKFSGDTQFGKHWFRTFTTNFSFTRVWFAMNEFYSIWFFSSHFCIGDKILCRNSSIVDNEPYPLLLNHDYSIVHECRIYACSGFALRNHCTWNDEILLVSGESFLQKHQKNYTHRKLSIV
jgi:hypothetical protein